MSYTLTPKNHSRLKSRLTYRRNRLKRAKVSGDKSRIVFEANQIVQEVKYAIGIFESEGYPDDWSNWTRASDDAQSDIRHYGNNSTF